jgi:hypothetical protein
MVYDSMDDRNTMHELYCTYVAVGVFKDIYFLPMFAK